MFQCETGAECFFISNSNFKDVIIHADIGEAWKMRHIDELELTNCNFTKNNSNLLTTQDKKSEKWDLFRIINRILKRF